MERVGKEKKMIEDVKNVLYEIQDIVYNQMKQEKIMELEKAIKIIEQNNITLLYKVDVCINGLIRLFYETGILRGIDNMRYNSLMSKFEKIHILINSTDLILKEDNLLLKTWKKSKE